MFQQTYYYIVEGERLPLKLVDTVRFVSPAKDEPIPIVAARLARSSRLSIDRVMTPNTLVVRGDPEKLRTISSYNDISHTRNAFLDRHRLEVVLTDHILVRFDPSSTSGDRRELCHRYGCEIVATGEDYWTLRVTDTGEAAPLFISNELWESPIVEYAEPNFLQELLFAQRPNDTRFVDQWHLENTGQNGGVVGADVSAVGAWAITFGEPAIRIAIHDSGVDIDHPDLAANMLQGKDFANDDSNASNNKDAHGTACAGIVAAAINNLGVVGIAPRCRIVPMRVPNPVKTSDLADTFSWAGKRADIISCSWSTIDSNTVTSAIRKVIKNGRDGRGIPVFFAVGNGGMQGIGYPSSLEETIAVGASTNLDERAVYSQFGDGLDFLAPSSGGTLGIETTDNAGADGYNTQTGTAGDYVEFSGTSAAAPLAAGTGALLLSANATLTAQLVRTILRETAEKIDPNNANYDANGWSLTHGFGRINASAATQIAARLRPAVRNGAFIIVWQDDKDKNGKYQIMARGFHADGADLFQDMTVNSVASGQQFYPVVAATPNGNFVVAWQDDMDENERFQIMARGFRSDGLGRFHDMTVNSVASGQQLRPAIAMDTNGNFVVVWQDDKDKNGKFQIMARGFRADGSELFHDITVNSVASGQQLLPAVAMDERGNFVVVWQDDKDKNGKYQIMARGFRSDGSERFHDMTVNSIASGQQLRPAIAMGANGNFVVVWQDDKDENDKYQIRARGFRADGSELFHDMTVNSIASGQQLRPAVAMDESGNFVVVWEDDKDGNSKYQIRARGFRSDGSELFHDITVNSVASGQQLRPAVAMHDNGDFVVVWQDDKDKNGKYQILARGFRSDGSERFHDMTVNSVASGQQLLPEIAII